MTDTNLTTTSSIVAIATGVPSSRSGSDSAAVAAPASASAHAKAPGPAAPAVPSPTTTATMSSLTSNNAKMTTPTSSFKPVLPSAASSSTTTTANATATATPPVLHIPSKTSPVPSKAVPFKSGLSITSPTNPTRPIPLPSAIAGSRPVIKNGTSPGNLHGNVHVNGNALPQPRKPLPQPSLTNTTTTTTTTTTSSSSSSPSALRNIGPSSSVPTPRPPMPRVYLTTSALPVAKTPVPAPVPGPTANGTSTIGAKSNVGGSAPVLFDFRQTDKSPSSSYKTNGGTSLSRPLPPTNGNGSLPSGSTVRPSSGSPSPVSALGLTPGAEASSHSSASTNGVSLLSQQFGKNSDGTQPVPLAGAVSSGSTIPFGRRMSTNGSNASPFVPRMRPRAMSMQMKIKGELRQDGAEFSDDEDDVIIEGEEVDIDEDMVFADNDYDMEGDHLGLGVGDEGTANHVGANGTNTRITGGSKSATAKHTHHNHKVAVVNGQMVAGVGTGSGGIKGRRKGMVFRCESCAKVYRHPSCLSKHRWEHSPHWGTSSKLLLSKHQQVQLLEAATILVHLDPSNPAGGRLLPEDKSLWPAVVSPPPRSVQNGRMTLGRHSSSSSKSNFSPFTPSSSLPNPTTLPLRKPSPNPSTSSTESSERSSAERDSGYSSTNQSKRRRPSDAPADARPVQHSPLPPRQSMVSPTHRGSFGDLGFSRFHIGSQNTATPGSPGLSGYSSLTPPTSRSQLRSPGVYSNLALPESSLRSGTLLGEVPYEEDEDEEDEDEEVGAGFASRTAAQAARQGSVGARYGNAFFEDKEKEDMDWEMEM